MLNAEQAEHNLGLANSRIPPTWSVESDRRYPLRKYIQDLDLWVRATDLPLERQGPAVALRLTGNVREMIREMPAEMISVGQDIVDAEGNVVEHRTGIQCLVRALNARFGALEQEVQIFNVSELMTFQRYSHESTDEMLSRFDLTMFRATDAGNIAPFNPVIRSWLVLSHLKIPRHSWPMLLAPTPRILPTTEQAYTQMIHYVRRNGHLYEKSGDVMKTLQHPYFGNEVSSHAQPSHAHDQHTYWQSNFSTAPDSYSQSYPVMNETADDLISWHSYSTGQSNPEEELDWADVEVVPADALGEHLYLQYRFAKRRFRAMAHKRGRFKGKGKGKGGKGRGKGSFKGKGAHAFTSTAFWTDPYSQNSYLSAEESYDTSYDSYPEIYVMGKGKGGKKGSGRGNPIGKDGKQMLCSTPGCLSPDHFYRDCPLANSKGGKSGGKGTKSSFPASQASASSTQGVRTATFAITDMRQDDVVLPNPAQSMITFADGTNPITLNLWNNLNPEQENVTFYPWWQNEEGNSLNVQSYHAKVRLEKGESLLVDTGAPKNMTGDAWFLRVSELAKGHGFGSTLLPLKSHISVEGVGAGASSCTQEGTVPIALATGEHAHYRAPIVSNSQIPALLGLESLESRRSILDLVHGKLIELGPRPFKIELPPGSRVLQMQKSSTGHMMLPCSEWGDKGKPSGRVFTTNIVR